MLRVEMFAFKDARPESRLTGIHPISVGPDRSGSLARGYQAYDFQHKVVQARATWSGARLTRTPDDIAERLLAGLAASPVAGHNGTNAKSPTAGSGAI